METETRARPAGIDYELVFKLMPGMCLILDPGFTIVAQNQEHAQATLSFAKDVVGKNLFAAFPDNPDNSAADGVSAVRASLLKVLKTRKGDAMPVVRYDVKPARGPYETRWWAITNTPVLGEDGYVRWIINRAEDVTRLVMPGMLDIGGE
jgi:PAS domain-containing protein